MDRRVEIARRGLKGEIALIIDDVEVRAPAGATVLEAALQGGVYIPHLCFDQDFAPETVCRLCLVEIKGRGVVTSCNTPIVEGMVVGTETPEVNAIRRVNLSLLIANHHGNCLECFKNVECELQRVAAYLGVDEGRMGRLRRPTETKGIDDSNPFFNRDHDKCILCGICVRTCDEIEGIGAIDFAFRGWDTRVATFANRPIVDSICESCAECVVRCPVGALIPKNLQKPSREVKTICTYCGCGCGVLLGIRGGRVVSARGDRENPVNRGSLCVKGRFGHEFINHPERLTKPLIKRNGELVEAGWDEALDLVGRKLGEYQGGHFAAISSAKCTNEENYLVQKFTRVVMGTNNIDHCARLCHAPSVAGLVQSFGSGAMTNSIAEIGDARCIFAIGTNTTAAHPIVALQVKKAVKNGAKLIVSNPREISLVRHASIFLRHQPGSDVALLMGMMRVIVDEGLQDSEFIEQRCENFDAFRESLSAFDLDFVEEATGVPAENIAEAARIYATCKPSTIIYAMGITQHSHGTDNVLAVSNLALLTGNLGRPSTGVNPLRGQNNVQGACDMGALPDVFPGYQRVSDFEARKKFEKVWGVNLPDQPGLTHLEIFDAAHQGKIKAVYLVGENPLISEANSKHTEEGIKRLDFFVVQDIFLTETARLADVVLPAASFAEKDGTVTNTERRVQRIRKALGPVGDSRPDWRITCEIAKRMGAVGFDFRYPNEIMKEISSIIPSYAGISYERLENGSLQWPCPNPDHTGTPILHVEHFATGNGKARFLPVSYRPPAEVPDEQYPFVLTTERSLYHFHTATMTRKVKGLNILRSGELVEINPKDAEALGISNGDDVKVVSRRGEVRTRAMVTEVSPPGIVSMTFHFAESPTNVLTSPALDPIAKIPETKVCAVRIEKLK